MKYFFLFVWLLNLRILKKEAFSLLGFVRLYVTDGFYGQVRHYRIVVYISCMDYTLAPSRKLSNLVNTIMSVCLSKTQLFRHL